MKKYSKIVKIMVAASMLAFVIVGCEKEEVITKSETVTFKAAETGGGTKPVMRTFYEYSINGKYECFCDIPAGDCLPTVEVISTKIKVIRDIFEMKGDLSKCMSNFFKEENETLSKVVGDAFVSKVVDCEYKVSIVESDHIYYVIFKDDFGKIDRVLPMREN